MQIINEENPKSIIKEDLASFSENTWEYEHPNNKIEVKFEHGGVVGMDKMFKSAECRRDFERFEENTDYEFISNTVDEILETKLLVDSEVKIVNYNGALDIAMKVLKEIE